MTTPADLKEYNRWVNGLIVGAIAFCLAVFAGTLWDEHQRKDQIDFAYECGKVQGELIERTDCAVGGKTIRFKDRDETKE